MSEEPRIGVYVCNCGINISATVDVEEVAKYAGALPNVIVSKAYIYMCSDPGQELIKQDIQKHKLNRVVVASCSPRMHEPTFRAAVEEVGVNKYLYEHVNIREHVSWVHANEPEKATEKAKDLLRMAIAKVRLDESLETRTVSVIPKSLVIGGGISGMQAALDLADRGFETFLVEKEPSIGGRVAQLSVLSPTVEEARPMLKKIMDRVATHPKINLMTYSDVVEVSGYIGNFEVKVKHRPRHVKNNNVSAKCVEVCPVEVPSEFDAGLASRKAIYTPFEDSIPSLYVIDDETCIKCGKCVDTCPEGTIDLDEQASEETINVGTIIVATGGGVFDAKNKPELGFGKYPNVINNLQLERLTDKAGPTKGKLLRPSDNKIPQKIAFIQCVGARDPDVGNPWCSRFCCQAMLGQVKSITEEYPKTQLFVFHKDIRAFSNLGEELYREVRGTGQVVFVRTPEINDIDEDPETGNLIVKATDEMLQMPMEAEVDMVVLSNALAPPQDAEELARLLVIARSPDGFFLELHPKLSPLDTPTVGIYIAGVAQGPKDITDSIAQARGAASRAAVPMAQGEVELEAYLAVVDPDLCSGCRICEHVCPYNAPEIKEREDGTLYSEVSEALCKGCGVCVAACPSGAITMLHFKDDQLMSEIEALLTG